MIVYVTQGHENGIGIEIFLKAFSLLSRDKKSIIRFVGFQKSIEKTLRDNNLPLFLLNDLVVLEPVQFTSSESLSALLYAISICGNNDVLITQPTTKDQLIYENITHLGHTEFFRYFYNQKSIPMSFIGPRDRVLLLTDHIPIKEIPTVSFELLFERAKHCINGFKKIKHPLVDVFIAGINPHSGEGGLLGTEDTIIHNLKKNLTLTFPDLVFNGPISGDALHFKSHKNSLLIYTYHDQGLTYFKSHNGLLGINTTFGLPYIRLSVDHGTAFEIYGKNKADFSSMMYLFDFVFRI